MGILEAVNQIVFGLGVVFAGVGIFALVVVLGAVAEIQAAHKDVERKVR